VSDVSKSGTHFGSEIREIGGIELLPEDVPITAVSKILGHANPAITMGIHAHELQEDLDQVRVAMGKFG
jgi:integrase